MINLRAHGFLLSFVFLLMGVVQGCFALLSLFAFGDHVERSFALSSSTFLLVSVVLIFWCRKFNAKRLSYRDAFLFASLTWVGLGFMGAWPIHQITHLSWTDSTFESISAITTTGATVLSGLDALPKSFLMYRQFLQWMGGLGVVIFVVAVLPMLNVGGMVLLKAETPGPMKDDKIAPRISKTAHILWVVYLVITVLCAVCYYLAGMDSYDAIAHSLTTVSTGGFSTHDASLGFFDSNAIYWVANVFMFMGAVNFALHFRAVNEKNIGIYWRDEETRWFIVIILALAVIISWSLLHQQHYDHHYTAFNRALFMLISFITSTGFGAFDVASWPTMSLVLLVVAGYMGGCAGSTAGGNKIIRLVLACKLVMMEFKQILHPRSVLMTKYHQAPVEGRVLSSIMAYFAIVGFCSAVMVVGLMLTDLDFWSSLTAVAACVNVLGPAFGELGNNFQPVSDTGVWILNFGMIMGRLEYLTLLVLFMPGFWRR